MASPRFRFDRFELDVAERRLTRDGAQLELGGRYLDALALLVGDAGALVTKDRFLGQVWRGVPVTDEALTQCIKALRKALGDDAATPRFIETVPKHGYRFIASVQSLDGGAYPVALSTAAPSPSPVLLAAAGTIGGGLAGLLGGLVYGLAAASQPAAGVGGLSVLLVVLSLAIAVAVIGAAGVSIGIAATDRFGRGWIVAGGAIGGLIVGAAAKLLGLDAFDLLLGQSPVGITGGSEGGLIGGAVGLGLWLGRRGRAAPKLRRVLAISAAIGAATGSVIAFVGGRLLAGSLDLLAQTFPSSRLRLDAIGTLIGEAGLGPVSQVLTGAAEGGLFAAFVAGAITLAERQFRSA